MIYIYVCKKTLGYIITMVNHGKTMEMDGDVYDLETTVDNKTEYGHKSKGDNNWYVDSYPVVVS